jgi:AraC family transcriptional regulator
MLVQGVDQLYAFVISKGWSLVTEVTTELWGGRTCEVTTIDGSILKFFEV